MSAAVGPFAAEEGLVPVLFDGDVAVRIHNTNTGKIIVSRFRMRAGRAEVSGDMRVDGVSGTGAPIRLDFLEPGGSKTGRLLPTGRATERLEVHGSGGINVSLVDAPTRVFVRAQEVGCTGYEMPDALEGNERVMGHLESIRCAASVAMGLAATIKAAGKSEHPKGGNGRAACALCHPRERKRAGATSTSLSA